MEAFSLWAKLVLDSKEYEKGLGESESFAQKAGGKIASAIGTASKVIGAGLVATSTAVAGLVKASVDAYGEYEQLTGGVKKLYGNMGKSLEEWAEDNHMSVEEASEEWNKLETAQNNMLANADRAFETAGMSANDYIQNVTGFSAALINSVAGDTVKAAEMADMAMRDIADNANTFGTYTAQELAGVYQALAKGQYQTLDNLNLGFGGTKEGMQSLIDKANELAKAQGDMGNLTIDSYADIVQAIHLVQEDMNITGTTANEAATTIQGSFGMLKASWQNLVAGFANPDADIGQLIGDMVGSASKFLGNLIPAMTQALSGIGQAVQKIAPIIAEQLPSLVESVLPPMINAAISLLDGLVAALPTILQVLIEQAPSIMMTIIDAIISLAPMLIDLGMQMILALSQGLIDNLPQLIPAVIDAILQIVDTLTSPDAISQLINAAIQIIQGLINGLIQALPQLIPAGIQIITGMLDALIQALPILIEMLPSLIEQVITALIDNIDIILDAIIQVMMAIIQAIIENLPLFIEAAIRIIMALTMGIIEAMPDILAAIVKLIGELINTIIKSLPKFLQNGMKLVKSIIEGIVKALPTLLMQGLEMIAKFIEAIVSTFAKIKETGKNVIHQIWEGIKSLNPLQWGKDLIQSFIDGILAKWESLKQTVSNIANSVKEFLGFSEPEKGPLSDFHTYAPDMMDLFMQGIEDNKKKLQDTVADAFNFQPLISGPEMNMNGTGASSQVWNINIYQPMESATDVARAIREESQYGLIGGESLAY